MATDPEQTFLVEMQEVDRPTAQHPCPGCGGSPGQARLCADCTYVLRNVPHVLAGLGFKRLSRALFRVVRDHLPQEIS